MGRLGRVPAPAERVLHVRQSGPQQRVLQHAHAIAAVASNGVWIVSQFVSLDVILHAIRSGSWSERIFVVLFYTTFTVAGSVLMHWVGKTYIEKGKRRVGA